MISYSNFRYSSLYGHDAFFVDGESTFTEFHALLITCFCFVDFFFGPKIRRFISGSLLDTKGDGSIDD